MRNSNLLSNVVVQSLVVGLLLVGCGDEGTGGSSEGGGGDTSDGGSDTGDGGADNVDPESVVHQVEGVDVETLAGSGEPGTSDGMEGAFNNPVNVIRDVNDRLVIADFDNGRLRVTTMEGMIDTLTEGDGFARPFGLALSEDGMVIAETDFNADGVDAGAMGGVIWSVDPATGDREILVENAGRPRGFVLMPSGEMLVTDLSRHDIRLLDPATGDMTVLAGKSEQIGFVDGKGSEARFSRPYGGVLLDDGSVLIADQGNHSIRKISPDGDVSTFAGKGQPGMVDGSLDEAYFNFPQDLAVDENGMVYVSDTGNHRIRRISPDGKVETLAGDGTAGYKDGEGGKARFFGQEGIDVEPDGSFLYVADGTGGEATEPYHRVRAISLP